MMSKTPSTFTVRDTRKGEWYLIDNALLRGGWGKELGPYGIAVYNAIVLHASADKQSAYPSHDKIAELTGMSRPTVWKFVQMLSDLNIISIEKKEGASHTYYLVDRAEWIPVNRVDIPEPVKEINTPVKEVNTPCKAPLQPPVKEVNTNNTHDNKTQENKTKEQALAADAALAPVSPDPEPEPTLTEVFAEMASIPLPALNTDRQKKEAGVRWFGPLGKIVVACDGDDRRAREVIQEAITQMDADDLTISTPQSVEKVAVGIAARCRRAQAGREKGAVIARECQEQSEAILAERQAEAAAISPKLKLALDTWASACRFLQGSLPRVTYDFYIASLKVLEPNGTFLLQAPTVEVYEWMTHRLAGSVQDALDSAMGRPRSGC
jgi:hypothetical protein